jgi:hypothetical protein
MPMHTSLTFRATSWLLQNCWRHGFFLVFWGGLLGAAQAQSTSVTSPNAAYSRPEVAGLGGVVPTAPVRLRVWGFEVYDARLWTPLGSAHAGHATSLCPRTAIPA